MTYDELRISANIQAFGWHNNGAEHMFDVGVAVWAVKCCHSFRSYDVMHANIDAFIKVARRVGSTKALWGIR